MKKKKGGGYNYSFIIQHKNIQIKKLSLEMKFKNNSADNFLQELWGRISEYSLLNASKNDIGDYLIYLLINIAN